VRTANGNDCQKRRDRSTLHRAAGGEAARHREEPKQKKRRKREYQRLSVIIPLGSLHKKGKTTTRIRSCQPKEGGRKQTERGSRNFGVGSEKRIGKTYQKQARVAD